MTEANISSADYTLAVVNNIEFDKDHINGTIYKQATYLEDYRAAKFDNQERKRRKSSADSQQDPDIHKNLDTIKNAEVNADIK